MMKIVLIPLAILLFVFIYPFAEYAVDCPSAMTDPVANNEILEHFGENKYLNYLIFPILLCLNQAHQPLPLKYCYL